MTSFYWPIGKISGELYIGKGAGKRLLRYVDNAQKSVKVFSPYMSASFISTLFDKSEQGVNVECVSQIVSDTEDKQLSKDTFGLDRIHRRCIKQTAYVNQEKQNEKERRLRNAHKSLKLSLGLLVAALLSFLLSIASFQNFIDHSLSGFSSFWQFFLCVCFLQQTVTESWLKISAHQNFNTILQKNFVCYLRGQTKAGCHFRI